MKARPVKSVRCAIYTRVSTEQGLDQDFNSLDAQYEAASAYIRNVRSEDSSHPAIHLLPCHGFLRRLPRPGGIYSVSDPEADRRSDFAAANEFRAQGRIAPPHELRCSFANQCLEFRFLQNFGSGEVQFFRQYAVHENHTRAASLVCGSRRGASAPIPSACAITNCV